MTNDERPVAGVDDEEMEWEADQLVALLGRYLARTRPEILEDDPRFMNWVAQQARARGPVPGDWPLERVRRMRNRILDRVLAHRLGFDLAREPLRVREAPLLPFPEAVRHAARAGCAPWPEPAVAAGEGREITDEACDRWVALPAGVTPAEHTALTVKGDSMLPLLHDGDTVLIRLGGDLKRNTVVVARRGDDEYVVKRVGEVRGRSVELLSLNPSYSPVRIPRDGRCVLGTVIMRWCPHDAAPIRLPSS